MPSCFSAKELENANLSDDASSRFACSVSPQASGPAATRPAVATRPPTIPSLPYKLVEWPTPPISAAGVPGAWNFIQVSSVAITARGTVLVLHRGAHPIMEFDSNGKFVRSWGDGMFSEGKVAAIPEAHWTEDKSHYSAVYGPAGCTACGAHSVRVDPQGNIWVDRRARPRRLQAERRGEGDHAPRQQGRLRNGSQHTSICRPTSPSLRTAMSTSATVTAARAW